jgi:CRISPR-associated protein Cmr4
MLHLHTLRPLHIGSGSADGTIDLPHSREAGTGYPDAPGSGLKGVIRDEFAETKHLELLFGPRPGDAGNDKAGVGTGKQGALMFSDGLLLCLPVRSWAGGFAWVTSPLSLLRYTRERAALGLPELARPAALAALGGLAIDACACTDSSSLLQADFAYLQDLRLKRDAAHTPAASGLASGLAGIFYPQADPDSAAWRDLFRAQFMVASEAVFGYLCDMAMDVRARVRLREDSKTADGGALWYEESVPAESLLWATVAADPVKEKSADQVMGLFMEDTARLDRTRLGGKATIGRGVARLLLEQAR